MSGADERAREFLENAAKAAAGAHLAQEPEALRDTLAAIVPPGATVYCQGATPIEQAVLDLFPNRVAEYAAAAVTVEEVFGAIAETGTVVCANAAGGGLPAGRIPAHHVVIVRRERIFAGLDDFFAEVVAAPPTQLTLVTGPGSTADAAPSPDVCGHGPARLDVVVV